MDSLYNRLVRTYENLCISIDRLDDPDFAYKEIARGDVGSDLAFLRELINEVHSLERKYQEQQAEKQFMQMAEEFLKPIPSADKNPEQTEKPPHKKFFKRA